MPMTGSGARAEWMGFWSSRGASACARRDSSGSAAVRPRAPRSRDLRSRAAGWLLRRLLLRLILVIGVEDDRLDLLEDDLLGDHHLAGALAGRNLVHHVQHRRLEDGAQAARAG